MKSPLLSIAAVLTLCSCQTTNPHDGRENGQLNRIVTDTIKSTYSYQCTLSSIAHKGQKTMGSLWWRKAESADKDLTSDIYLIRCKEGATFFVDIPSDGSSPMAVQTGRFKRTWPAG